MTDRLTVELGDRSYEIVFAPLASDEISRRIAGITGGRRPMLVTDRNMEKCYPELIAAFPERFILEPGEQHKNVAGVAEICSAAVRLGLDRKSCLLALGGGVVGDMTGFAAAMFMRGIDFIQVPTTLLAMVDSSIGGKTGVDLPEGKNLIGAFHQPRLVAADLKFLTTLPEREIRNGLGEIVKYGVSLDAGLFARLEQSAAALLAGDPEAFAPVVRRCCELKAAVVAADEREGGRRAVLNFGHTFGHAVELLSGFSIAHGEAVAIGCRVAGEMSVQSGRWSRADRDRMLALLEKLGLPAAVPREFAPAAILEAMRHDKKTAAGQLTVVLPTAIGAAEIVAGAPESDILAAIGESYD